MMGVVEKLAQLCRNHGIVYPAESVLNSSALTCYNYGPVGALLRRNLMNQWWHATVATQGAIYPVENALMKAGQDERRGQLQTKAGPEFQGQQSVRSSLSTGMLVHYLPLLTQLKLRLPFGLAQTGRCVQAPPAGAPHHFLCSSDEYSEMVLQFYVPPKMASYWMDHWQRTRFHWWNKLTQLPATFIVSETESPQGNDLKQIHIEYKFPWGKETIETISDHGNQHLAELEDTLGISLQGKYGGCSVLPHVVELHTIVERGLAALLINAYTEKDLLSTDVPKQKRVVLQLHPKLAPYKVAIVSKASRQGSVLREVADHVAKELRNTGVSVLDHQDVVTDIGSYLSKYDPIGIPWVVILTDKTLEIGHVLLQNRDTTLREPVSLVDLAQKLVKHISTS